MMCLRCDFQERGELELSLLHMAIGGKEWIWTDQHSSRENGALLQQFGRERDVFPVKFFAWSNRNICWTK
jgi:hypothetical protein